MMSPAPSCCQPLASSTRRVVSIWRMTPTMRFVSNCPHFSLKGTHATMDVMLRRCSTMSRSSRTKSSRAAGESFHPLGMSCHTASPSGWNDSPPARHVLPHRVSELVGIVVPPRRFDLDVLANHVEAERFHHLDVMTERVVRRRGVEAVGPPPLVEWTQHERRLSVQPNAHKASRIGATTDRSHAEVARYRIDDVTALAQRDLEVIQKRIVRTPRVGVRNR